MDSKNRKYICSGCNRAYARKINLGFHKNHCDAELLGETNTTKRGTQHGEGVAVGNQNREGTNDSGEGVATNDQNREGTTENGVATNDQNGEGANDQFWSLVPSKGAAINDQNGEGANDKYIELQSALGRTFITFRKKIDADFKVLDQIFESDIPEKLSEELKIHGSFKWFTDLVLQFHRPTTGAITEPPVVLGTVASLLLRSANYETICQQSQSAYAKILEDIETFSANGSGWVLDKIIASDISLAMMPKGITIGNQDDSDDNDDDDDDGQWW